MRGGRRPEIEAESIRIRFARGAERNPTRGHGAPRGFHLKKILRKHPNELIRACFHVLTRCRGPKAVHFISFYRVLPLKGGTLYASSFRFLACVAPQGHPDPYRRESGRPGRGSGLLADSWFYAARPAHRLRKSLRRSRHGRVGYPDHCDGAAASEQVHPNRSVWQLAFIKPKGHL